jgi:hypothetical protein
MNKGSIENWCTGKRNDRTTGSLWFYVNSNKRRIKFEVSEFKYMKKHGGAYIKHYEDSDTCIIVNKKGYVYSYWVGTGSYVYVTIKEKKYAVHKLVNKYINGNKYKDICDHINTNRKDFRPSNLRSVNSKQNNIYSNGVSIMCVETNEILLCIRDAYRKLGNPQNGSIQRVIKNGDAAFGFHWKLVPKEAKEEIKLVSTIYVDETLPFHDYEISRNAKIIKNL